MKKKTLVESVQHSVKDYLNTMDGSEVNGLYDLVMTEVEAPLIACVLDFTNNNQSQAAAILGLNRGTLRRKLRKHQLL